MDRIINGAEEAHFQAAEIVTAGEADAALPKHELLMREDLARSGITPELAESAGIFAVEDASRLQQDLKTPARNCVCVSRSADREIYDVQRRRPGPALSASALSRP